MDAGIELFIRDSYFPDKADALLESFDIFNDIPLEDHENDFNELLMLDGTIDKTELTVQFENLVTTLLYKLFQEHGIKVAEETPLHILNQICRGLLEIEYYLDGETILRTIESDLDNEEKVSELIALCCPLEAELIVFYIEEVSPSLIDKTQELFEERVTLDKGELEKENNQRKIISKLRDITRFIDDKDLIGYRLISAGVYVGADFERYIQYIQHETDTMDIDKVSKELFFMLNMSSESLVNIIACFTKYSDLLFHNVDKITKVYNRINKLILDFDRYMLQRTASLKNSSEVV